MDEPFRLRPMASRTRSSSGRRRSVLLAGLAPLAVAAGLTAACTGAARAAGHPPSAHFKVCLALDNGVGSSLDRLAVAGLARAEGKRVTGYIRRSRTPAADTAAVRSCLRAGASLTIGVGLLMENAVDAVAIAYPARRFAIINAGVASLAHRPQNVTGIIFPAEQAGYLVGYAAALWAKHHRVHDDSVVGSIGSLSIPPVDSYLAGFQFGAHRADPQVTVINEYSQNVLDPAKCRRRARDELAKGASVVFAGRRALRPGRLLGDARARTARDRLRRRPAANRRLAADERRQAFRQRRGRSGRRSPVGDAAARWRSGSRRPPGRARLRRVEPPRPPLDPESGREAGRAPAGRSDPRHPEQAVMARGVSKHRSRLGLLLLLVATAAGCGGQAARKGSTLPRLVTSTVSSEALHIGVVGGLSFSATGAVADRGTLDRVADDSLVLVPAGAVSDEALRLVARAHPASHFAVIGGSAQGVRLRNVAGVLLRRDQAAYLAGLVLGLLAKAGGTQHPNVALVGPAAESLLGAFRHGVRVAFDGAKATGAPSSENPAACKEAALAAIDEGAIAVVSSRGPCALGALSAAAEQHVVGQSLADFEVRGAIASAVVRAALQGVYYGREDLNYGVRAGAVGVVRLDPLIPSGVAVQARAAAQRFADGLPPIR